VILETVAHQENGDSVPGFLYDSAGGLKAIHGARNVSLADRTGHRLYNPGGLVTVIELGGGWYAFQEIFEFW